MREIERALRVLPPMWEIEKAVTHKNWKNQKNKIIEEMSSKNKKSKVPRTMNAAGTFFLFFFNSHPHSLLFSYDLKNTNRCAGGETETIGRVTVRAMPDGLVKTEMIKSLKNIEKMLDERDGSIKTCVDN